MEYFNNILCISAPELFDGIMSLSNYKQLCHRGILRVVRRACAGNTALVDLSTIPSRFKEAIYAKYGEPENQAASKSFKDRITPDAEAITFYSHYLLSDGRNLPEAKQREYAQNAAVLNTLRASLTDMIGVRKALGASMAGFWRTMLGPVNEVRVELGHSLPANEVALKRKYQEYTANGYEALISKKFCNDNSRKVSQQLENLLMSIYAMPNKPFVHDIHEIYKQFLAGVQQITDQKTGEIFNPKDFIVNGKALELSYKTVWNYMNQPLNRAIVDRARSGGHYYNTHHRPHHHRHAPNFSFSKVTMDDRDLPRKLVGGGRVKVYHAMDVLSGCFIGCAYSLDKNEELFVDCLRDMFRLIERENFPMPMQVEVENHLVNKFFDDLANMFPFVRICNPGNSQEKYAETLIRSKKYGIEKKTQNDIGRFYAKSEATRVDRDKKGDEFVEKNYTFERLVADDKETVREHNNSLHPNQKRFPGKTRWQVLLDNLNPNAPQVSKPVIYKAIGEHTRTTIVRNQYMQVQYAKYQIASTKILDRLQPGNYQVDAYYLPDPFGKIDEVFIYQNGTYLCKAERIVEYNRAKSERTEADEIAYTEQAKFVSEHDAITKHGKEELAKVHIERTEEVEAAAAVEADPVETAIVKPTIEEELNDNEFDPDVMAAKAIDRL